MDANTQIILAVIGLAIIAVKGGAISTVLEMWPWFHNWKPQDWGPQYVLLKPAFVLGVTALVGGTLVWLQVYLVPEYFPMIAIGLKVWLASVFGFMSTQVTHSAVTNNQPTVDLGNMNEWVDKSK